MRPTQLLTSLYLAQAAAAAPILLVAGSSAKAVFIRPARQMTVAETAQIVWEATKDEQRHASPKTPSSTWDASPAALLDAEGPLSTADLMALSKVSSEQQQQQQQHQQQEKRPAAVPKVSTHATRPMTTTTLTSNKGKISVGTLVVPGSHKTTKAVMASLFDPTAPRPYLVPGYYIPSQRADVMVVGIILAFVLVVLAVETWGPVSRTISWIFQRQGSIRLEDGEALKVEAIAHVDCEDDEEDDDDDDDMAPFGGIPRRRSSLGFQLPEKVDAKSSWI